LKDISSPEVVLNVAMLVLVGTPALQLPGVLHRLDDVLVQLSVVCAHAACVRIIAIPNATKLRGFLSITVFRYCVTIGPILPKANGGHYLAHYLARY